MPAGYIPAPDAQFSLWIANFAILIAATPTAYGLVAGDATAITAANTAFQTAYTLATDPATRTAPTVAAKDAARASAEFVVRPYAMQINMNAGVDNEQRADLGLTIRKTVPTPIPAPTSQPGLALVAATPGVLTVRFFDVATPTSKAKPFGSIGVELHVAVGTVPAVSPEAARFYGTLTKSPARVEFDPEDAGKIATLYARFVTRSGPGGVSQVGPWSSQLVSVVI